MNKNQKPSRIRVTTQNNLSNAPTKQRRKKSTGSGEGTSMQAKSLQKPTPKKTVRKPNGAEKRKNALKKVAEEQTAERQVVLNAESSQENARKNPVFRRRGRDREKYDGD